MVRARARLADRALEVIDTPGINDLATANDETRVTTAMIERHADAVIVQVADAHNLRRALLLTLQLAELGRPMVLVLNMADELAARGGKIDAARLEAMLGVPVVRTIAVRNHGTDELVEALSRRRRPTLEPVAVPAEADEYERNRARLARIHEMHGGDLLPGPARAAGASACGWASGRCTRSRAWPLAALALLVVFWFVGLFGAGTLVDLLGGRSLRAAAEPGGDRARSTRLLPFPHTHEVDAVPASLALPISPVHEIELLTWERRWPSAPPTPWRRAPS